MTPRMNLFAVIALLTFAFWATPVWAGANDYVFEPVSVDVRNGPGSELAVRLVHKPTGKLISGAVIFRTRIDMSPDQMGMMTAKHSPIPETEPGVYRFKADLTMAGRWAFKLMARVQGEPATIEGSVIFLAKD